jgi:hypothetical protein
MQEVVVGIIPQKNPFQKKYLLISTKIDFGKYTGLYYPPGGHMKKGQDKGKILIKKIKHELGIDVSPLKELAKTSGDVEGQITYWWTCEPIAKNTKFEIRDKLVNSARWFLHNEIVKSRKVWPATKKFFKEYLD